MNKSTSLIVSASIGLSISLFGCSSSAIPNIQKLATTSKSQNYYYCESCPVPTQLVKQEYLPLEPDEPVVEVKPIVVAEPVKPVKRSIKHKRHHKRKAIKNSQTNRKPQCVQWK